MLKKTPDVPRDADPLHERLSACLSHVAKNLFKSLDTWEDSNLATTLRDSSLQVLTSLPRSESELYLNLLTIYQLCGGKETIGGKVPKAVLQKQILEKFFLLVSNLKKTKTVLDAN